MQIKSSFQKEKKHLIDSFTHGYMIHSGLWVLKCKNRCHPTWGHYHSNSLFSCEHKIAWVLVGSDLGWDELTKKKNKLW